MRYITAAMLAVCMLCVMLTACGGESSKAEEPQEAKETEASEQPTYATEEGELPLVNGGDNDGDASAAAPTGAPAKEGESVSPSEAYDQPTAAPENPDDPNLPEMPSELASIIDSGNEYELPFVPVP